jgi:DNA-binding CsgD family transcriptional regulator
VRLSPREREIVRMVAQGHSNKIIADVLNISSWTVGTHLRRIFAKLGVGSRAAVVARLPEISRACLAAVGAGATLLCKADTQSHAAPCAEESQCFASVRSEPALRRNS